MEEAVGLVKVIFTLIAAFAEVGNVEAPKTRAQTRAAERNVFIIFIL
jgi:hypothetical protein